MSVLNYIDGTNLGVDSMSQAFRSVLYRANGKPLGQKWTYSFADTVKRAMSATTLNYGFLIGGEGKIVRLQRLLMMGTHTTSANYLELGIRKYKDYSSASFSSIAGKYITPHDSNAPGSMASVVFSTAGITLTSAFAQDEWVAQPICSSNQFLPITGTPASGPAKWDFDFRYRDESEAPTLRGPREALGWYFRTSPSQIVTSTFCMTWTEEDA